jgi:anti-sigma factor RsiW
MAANHDGRRQREDREEEALQAYYDGELGRWARWRMQRRLERSPELRRELVELEALSGLVRASAPEVAIPDLWSGIERGLAVADAERRIAAEAAGERASVLDWLFRPAAALVAAGAAAAALAMLLLSSETAPGGVVHWVDSGARNVMVLDGEDDVTVIWVFDPIGDGASRGGRRGAA